MLLLVLPILVIVTIAFTLFGTIQVRFEEERLIDDLKRKAWAVNESLEFSVRSILVNHDLEGANRLVESFQRRERLQGCAIYDRDGKILAITERIAAWGQGDRPYIKEVLAEKVPRGGLESFNEYSVYSYVLPVRDQETNFLGMVEVVYELAS